jgi:hypothetical protein
MYLYFCAFLLCFESIACVFLCNRVLFPAKLPYPPPPPKSCIFICKQVFWSCYQFYHLSVHITTLSVLEVGGKCQYYLKTIVLFVLLLFSSVLRIRIRLFTLVVYPGPAPHQRKAHLRPFVLYGHPRFHYELSQPSITPFWAFFLLWCGSGFGFWLWCGSTTLPKIMRIRIFNQLQYSRYTLKSKSNVWFDETFI